MRKTSKYQRGICGWPKCMEPRDIDAPYSYVDETWILPHYCNHHGPMALARRNARIATARGIH